MIDCEKLIEWIWKQQLDAIPNGEEKHWLHHSTSALMAYQNVLDYLERNK